MVDRENGRNLGWCSSSFAFLVLVISFVDSLLFFWSYLFYQALIFYIIGCRLVYK
jgi:hypothetical protein